MNEDQLFAETKKALITLKAISNGEHEPTSGSAWAFGNIDIDLTACKLAAEVSGAEETLCKMLNKKFRDDATSLMFKIAQRDVANTTRSNHDQILAA